MTYHPTRSSRAAASVILAIVFSLVGLAVLVSYDAPTALAKPGNGKGNGGGSTTPPAPACSDGKDNDADGQIDFPSDPGCTDANDTDETDAVVPPPPPSDFEYGLRMGHTWWLTDTQMKAQMDKAKDAGATTVQIVTSWRKLAPTAHRQYDWTYLDNAVSAAEARGLKPHLQLEKTPRWMEGSCTDCSSFTPPRSATALGQFREFSEDVAARYGTRAHRIEVWNEPNLTDFWETGPDPTEFAALQRAGYLGVKQANANVRVTSGSIANADQGFLNEFYNAVGAYSDAAQNNKFFDELGMHPYSSCGYPNATALAPDQPHSCALWAGKWGPVDNNFGGYKKMRTIMEQRGDSSKKMYFGELGYQATHNDPHWMAPIEDSTRADWLKKAYALAQGEEYISGLSWYSYVEDPRWNIANPDGTESLTFKAFRDVTP